MRGLVDEFKTFILRGNVLDLALAVVIGIAFAAMVTSLAENIITPILAAIGDQPDFSALTFTINGSEFHSGAFIKSLISFLIIALVVFFLIIKPVNALTARLVRPAAAAEPPMCPQCLSVISPDANRSPNCTTWLRGPNVAVS